jgi:hypothetical protein
MIKSSRRWLDFIQNLAVTVAFKFAVILLLSLAVKVDRIML